MKCSPTKKRRQRGQKSVHSHPIPAKSHPIAAKTARLTVNVSLKFKPSQIPFSAIEIACSAIYSMITAFSAIVRPVLQIKLDFMIYRQKRGQIIKIY